MKKRNLRNMAAVVLCLLLLAAAGAVIVRGGAEYRITITVPSDGNGPVTPGHGFFVSGVIEGERALPEGASLRVSVLDRDRTELRFAESKKKNDDRIDPFCDAFFYYAEDIDPERASVKAKDFPCLLVDGTAHSLQNANIKCWFSGGEFNAFIPYATDEAHGFIMDDGIGYTEDGRIVEAEAFDKLCLCRADLAVDAKEGCLNYNTANILAADTDFSDGISLPSQEGAALAIAGLVIPHQLKEEEILFDPANNETGLLNRVETIVYLVRDAEGTKRYEKPVSMIRVFEDGSVYDSVMEFYHLFSRDEIDSEKAYEISLYGLDKNRDRVEGTSERFAVNRFPDQR